jgi:hypothetical protein
MKCFRNRVVGVVCSLCLIAGCGSDGPTAPTTDFISLDSIVPAAGTSLNAGDSVTFTAVVTCTIVGSNGGFVVMAVTDQGNRSLVPVGTGQAPTPLLRGTATVTVTQIVTIPPSGSTVNVVVPLFVTESNATQALVRRSYTVR